MAASDQNCLVVMVIISDRVSKLDDEYIEFEVCSADESIARDQCTAFIWI